ncbi:hypothetical protein FACS1894159_10600 [Bacteroidia bacterium]|nr:hypothetical protein FACS1894159_10600 [Bacteroidia bacterium]
MKKAFFVIVCSLAAAAPLRAQDYNGGAGLWLGAYDAGLCFKYNLNPVTSTEWLLTFPYDGAVLLTGLYEHNIPVIDRGFHFYYGMGGHLGMHSTSKKARIGVDGITGLEYSFAETPLALSLDYRPGLDLIRSLRLRWDNIGVGIKVTF